MTPANSIAGRDLVVEYRTDVGPVRALAHTDLTVEAGTSLAIMGPSGCGKSTLLGLIAGLAVPTTGSVTIGDVVVSDLAERERVRFRRAVLGMVYQADNLLPHLTIEENVGLQLSISGRRHHDQDPLPLLGRLGLGELARRFPDQLSGGQRQRAAVARAVVHGPAVLLADEPTGALDRDSARRVIELLVAIHHEIGATFVIVTHDPEIAGYADRIVQVAPPPIRETTHAR